MPKVIRAQRDTPGGGGVKKAYHPAHGGVSGSMGRPVPDAPADQPSFASAPTKRPDPAPSRWSYRMTRLMLTPVFRTALRVGLPLIAAFAVTGGYLADEARRTHVIDTLSELRASIETRPEFMVQVMKIEGASADVAREIHEILPVEFPASSFDLDLPALRAIVSHLDPVERVQMRVQPGGTLLVQITERVPALIWRTADGLILLDDQGHPVRPLAQRSARRDLHVVAGDGADIVTAEALDLLAAAGPLHDRMRGLVRMGTRRWDVVLQDGQRILLPADAPVLALERVIAMDKAMDVLARDVSEIDMRLGHRPTLRMRANAVAELQRIRAIEREAGVQ